jgi:hypothetical protein
MKSIRMLGLVLVAAAIPACLSNNPNRTAPQPVAPATETTFKAAVLSGRQEVPPAVSTGTGTATIDIATNRQQITVTVEVTGLTGITEAHLHFGAPGVDGPIIFPLATTAFASPLTVTLTEADFLPADNVATFEAALLAIERGNMYVNVHTAAFPNGEIRGQVGPTSLAATLNGAQTVAGVLTFAAGSFTLTLNPDQTSMTVSLNVASISLATAAHIHVGPPGVDGPILFALPPDFSQMPLILTLTEADFSPQPGAGVSTFADAVDMILSGNAYADVHTSAQPGGEIRGQIVPSAGSVNPPSGSSVLVPVVPTIGVSSVTGN